MTQNNLDVLAVLDAAMAVGMLSDRTAMKEARAAVAALMAELATLRAHRDELARDLAGMSRVAADFQREAIAADFRRDALAEAAAVVTRQDEVGHYHVDRRDLDVLRNALEDAE